MNFSRQVDNQISFKSIFTTSANYLGAYYSINVDQRVMNLTKNNMTQFASRYTFDEAQVRSKEDRMTTFNLSSLV